MRSGCCEPPRVPPKSRALRSACTCIPGAVPGPASSTCLLAEDVPIERIALGHLTTAWDDEPYLRGLADRGATLVFDLFGFDHSLIGVGRWAPRDLDVAQTVVGLVAAGYGEQVMISHDIGVRSRLVAYGSWGYAHIPRHVVPLLLELGLEDAQVAQILVGQPGAPADGRRPVNSAFTQLSANLYWFRDTCNVFLIKHGQAALLIDAGSGGVLDHLADIGVEQIEWVLHTHHHRDQCQGDPRLLEHGAQIAVPAREAAMFEKVDSFWRMRSTFDDYDTSSLWNSLAAPVADRAGGCVTTRCSTGTASRSPTQPTPGHTRGSVTYLAEIDGQANAFSGDLIAAPGHVDTIHDLQWQYGMPDALGAAMHSVTLLATRPIDRLLPSHGQPMADAANALGTLATNLRELFGLLSEIRAEPTLVSPPP